MITVYWTDLRGRESYKNIVAVKEALYLAPISPFKEVMQTIPNKVRDPLLEGPCV